MQNLLSIEASFLNLPQVKQGLQLQEIRTVQRGLTNAKKKKFEQTLQLSALVLSAHAWFQSKEGQALCSEQGITWTSEDFGAKVFGWQKSYFYKVLKAAKLEASVVENFKEKCSEVEAQGKEANRSLEGLLKFARAMENSEQDSGRDEGSEEGETDSPSVERTATIFTLSFKGLQGNVSVRIDENGVVKTTNTTEEIAQAIQFLTNSLSAN
jgi:hypothetical protein